MWWQSRWRRRRREETKQINTCITRSKNKPKPPIIVTQDSPNSLRAHALEISSRNDICETLSDFARRKQRGICILSANGCVTNVTLRQPASSGAIVTLHEHFEILSLLGSILPPPSPVGITGLTIYLAGPQGQVVGGGVVGGLIASGPVVLMVASFMMMKLPPCRTSSTIITEDLIL
ncbi:hypothetical protein Bca4012_034462 [Brassica carinata]